MGEYSFKKSSSIVHVSSRPPETLFHPAFIHCEQCRFKSLLPESHITTKTAVSNTKRSIYTLINGISVFLENLWSHRDVWCYLKHSRPGAFSCSLAHPMVCIKATTQNMKIITMLWYLHGQLLALMCTGLRTPVL